VLDVVIRNAGIGHDFPSGMPDQQESWVEVRLLNATGKTVLASGGPGDPSVHRYRLAGLDTKGDPIEHGDLDRMVTVGEWRRIPAGGADLARYGFAVPAARVAELRARVLSRPRTEFVRWCGGRGEAPRVMAELRMKLGRKGGEELGSAMGARWRQYGRALTACRAYPAAIQALGRALVAGPRDAQSHLSLGQIYLEERDLLSALEQFRIAQAGAGDRALAWKAATLRLMGESEEALALLKPLVPRYDRDPRLHFELGRAYRDLHRFRDAAKEFKLMLDLDPLDVSAHYNRMLSLQRLNQLTEARQEEAIYRLMRVDETSPFPRKGQWLEDRPLHVHRLEALQ
jgi:hypothetical protein